MIEVDTEIKASSGQEENQSRVQQSTKEGNLRQRTRNWSPTGDMHSTRCKLLRTRSTKVEYRTSGSSLLKYYLRDPACCYSLGCSPRFVFSHPVPRYWALRQNSTSCWYLLRKTHWQSRCRWRGRCTVGLQSPWVISNLWWNHGNSQCWSLWQFRWSGSGSLT